jgi:hypothetical protein
MLKTTNPHLLQLLE